MQTCSLDNNRFILSMVKTIDAYLADLLKDTDDKKVILESIEPIKDDVYYVIALTSQQAMIEYCKTYKSFAYLMVMIYNFANQISNIE